MRVRFGYDSARWLSPALQQYRSELAEIIQSVSEAARVAGRDAKDYVPAAVQHEYEVSGNAQRVLQSDEAIHWGIEVPNEVLALIASAIRLRREALEDHLQSLAANPLTPGGALQVLRDEIANIDAELDRFWGQFGEAACFDEIRHRRTLKRGWSYPRDTPTGDLIAEGEGQDVEFMEVFPKNAHELAREIAAFGTSNAGTILIGVRDDGTPAGLVGLTKSKEQDRFISRIEGICSNTIRPPLMVRVIFEKIRRKTIARIHVPKGPEPIYYSHDVPYLRHGRSSRPAHPSEVIGLVQHHST